MKKAMIIVLTMILSFPFVQTVSASSLDFVKQDILTEGTLQTGVDYETFTATTKTDYGTEGTQHISVVTANNDSNYKIVAWSKLGDNSITKANMLDIARDYELHNPGYEVLAGINGDYYNMSNGTPINALVQEGSVIKYNNFNLERYFSVGFTNDETLYVSNKLNKLETTFTLTIMDNDGMIVKEVPLKGLSTIPKEGETTLYYKPLNTIEVNEAYMIEGNVTKTTSYGTLHLTGTLTDLVTETTTDATKFTVVTKDDVVESYLQAGYQIKVQKNMSGVYTNVDNIIGVGSQPLLDNQIKDFEDINDQNVDFAKSRQPRSSFGFTENGDFIIATFDGRQTDMDGVNLREMGYVMQQLGCNNAFNLDGGGSTQMIVKNEDDFIMLNSPSDNPYRNVSNGILIVREKVQVTYEVTNQSTSGFDFTLEVDETTPLQRYEVYVDGQLLDPQTTYSITDLDASGVHYIGVKLYLENSNVYTSYKKVDLREYQPEEPKDEKQEPSSFELEITPNFDTNSFKVTVEFLDPDDTIVKMYVLVNGEKKLVKKTTTGYAVEVTSAVINEEYTLNLEVNYILGSVTPKILTPDIEEVYTFYNADVPEEDTTQIDPVIVTVSGLLLVSCGVGLLYYFKRKKVA